MHIEPFRELVGIGVIAWNLTVLDDPELEKVGDLIEDVERDYRAGLEAILADLTARKRRLFPEDYRFIKSWEVSLMPSGRTSVTAVFYEPR